MPETDLGHGSDDDIQWCEFRVAEPGSTFFPLMMRERRQRDKSGTSRRA
ncbi:hypothetical protein [Pseudonocardia kunmingensis]|nr:hypothetical protein [Pseudonocardia kunmingensis]